jgi:hypothetical protein
MAPDLFARSADRQILPASLGSVWGYIDDLGLIAISFHFSNAGPFSEGLAPVALGKQYGYIDAHGTLQIPPRYEAAGAFKEGLAPVLRGEHWTFVDAEGKELPTPPLSWAEEFHEGLAAVRDPAMKWGYIDRFGALVIPCGFDRAISFSEGLGCVHRDGKTGYIDAKGQPIPNPGTWTDGKPFSEGLAAVAVNGVWGYIEKNGKGAIPPQFERAGEFSQGSAPVSVRKKFGYIDRTGKTVIEPRLEWAWPFSEGLACFTDSSGRYGFIDPTGRVIIRPQFDEAKSFSRELARVRIDNQWSYIRPNGALVWNTLDYVGWDLIEEISLERVPGLGGTGTYTVVFRSDGTAHYRGSGEGKRTGEFSGIIDKENFARLAKLIQSQGFFDMADNYPVRIDYPTATLRAIRDGKTKSVQADNVGGPTAWWGMVMAIDGLSSTLDWAKK